MDNYNELKELISKLYSMNENNKNLYDLVLKEYEENKISFNVSKELSYSIFRGEISNEKEILKAAEEIVEEEVVEDDYDYESIIQEDGIYCSKCGAKNEYDATICSECDSIILNHNISFCTRCGTKNLRTNGRCAECGFIIDDLVTLIIQKEMEINEQFDGKISRSYAEILDEYDNGIISHADAIDKIEEVYNNKIYEQNLLKTPINDKKVNKKSDESDKIRSQYISEIKNDRHSSADNARKCPVCSSTNIQFVTINSQKGVSVGKYFWGGLFFGELGKARALRSGTKGKTTIIRKCVDCGYEF